MQFRLNTYQSRVTEKLKGFGLNINRDIVASTHDGAPVMKKYGDLIDIENQLCYNHTFSGYGSVL